MDAKLKVSRAVTKCANAYPFFGSLMLSCGHKMDNSLPTAATDGRKIFWNSDFIDDCSEEETRGLLAHEIMHIILMHCVPHPGKDHKLCNIAMDYVINNTLFAEGFKLPKGGIVDTKREFVGMTWEQVYAILDDVVKKHQASQSSDGDEPDYSEGAAPTKGEMSEERQKELGADMEDILKQDDIDHIIENSDLTEEEKQKVRQKVVQAAEAAKSAGNVPGGILGELLDDIRETKVNWKDYLREMMTCRFPQNYTYRQPNRKFLGSGLYLPTMEGTQVGALAIGLDTSGSVSKDELLDFLAECNELTSEFNPEKVYLFYCDAEVAKYEVYEQGEVIDEIKPDGGGGTAFFPVFDLIKEEEIEIEQMIYMSDMEVGEWAFPKEEPEFPVLWLSTGQTEVPWGDVVKIH